MWKFAKTYPSGFPSIRIAQLAKLIHQSTFLLSKLLEAKKIEDIHGLFQVELDAYWETHYRFDVQSVKKSKIRIHGTILIIKCFTIYVLYWQTKRIGRFER